MKNQSRLLALVPILTAMLACTFGATPPATGAPTTAPTTAAAAVEPTAPPPPLDMIAVMAARPLVWFAPLPPMPTHPGRPFIGSEDFMSLFKPDAPWQTAAGHVQVFKLYGEWVGAHATDAQLRQAVADIRRRGMALAVEVGPLDAPPECGQGVEGFAGKEEGLRIASRIAAVGGAINILALDEPYYFAHVYDGPNACHWPVEKIAADVGAFIAAMQAAIPGVIIGDTEPLSGAADAPAYNSWLDTFRSVNGYNLAFLHMDVDWSRVTWATEVQAIAQHGAQIGVPVGMIYFGNGFDATDEAWLSAAGERVKKLELATGVSPDHVLFQSWNDKPDFTLPESQAFTWTHFINTYFADKSALGFRREGAGANLALGKPVQFSAQLPDNPATGAVDGDLGTLWNSGGGPLQWITIDLGAPHSIQAVRLTVSQYPEGETVHSVLVRGASGDFQLLHTFSGDTRDGDALEYTPPQPVAGIQFVRVETTGSPSWVSWREIEVIAAE